MDMQHLSYFRASDLFPTLFQQQYGCLINPEKTRTNVDNNGETTEEISFCGALINARTLEARPDFGSYFGRNIAFASKLNPRDGDSLAAFVERRINFLVTVNLDRLYQGPYSMHF